MAKQMDIKQYLKQYLILTKEIDRINDDIERVRSLAARMTQSFSSDRVQTSPRGDQLPDAIARIILLEDQLNAKAIKMLEMREQIEGLIDKVEDQTLRTLLKYRYISGLRWEEIAVKMNYSYRSVCYLHGRALELIYGKYIK